MEFCAVNQIYGNLHAALNLHLTADTNRFWVCDGILSLGIDFNALGTQKLVPSDNGSRDTKPGPEFCRPSQHSIEDILCCRRCQHL